MLPVAVHCSFHDTGGVIEHKLPAVEIAEHADHITIAGGHGHVPELGIAAGAHVNGAAFHIQALVIAAGVIFVDQRSVAGVGKLGVVEYHKLSLPLDQLFLARTELAEVGHEHGVDFRQIGQAVELRVAVEQLRSHERRGDALVAFKPRGSAELHHAVVFADIHTGQVHDQLLADTVVQIEVILVDGHRQRSCLVLNVKSLEDIAVIVRRSDTAGDYIVVAVLFHSDLMTVVGGIIPEQCLQLLYCGVGLDVGHRHQHFRIVEMILTGGKSGHGQQ